LVRNEAGPLEKIPRTAQHGEDAVVNDHGLGSEAIGGLLVYGGLTVFATYQLLLWFGVRERQALHLAAAAIFIALSHALSGDLAGVALPGGLGAWRPQLAMAMPLLALGALVSLARGYLGGAAQTGSVTRAMRATTIAALVAAATAPLWGARDAAPWLVSAVALAAFVVIAAAGVYIERGIRKRPRHSRLVALALLTLAAALAVRPHGFGLGGGRPEAALQLVSLAALLVLGYAVASRGQLARRERKMADLRHYIGQVMAADVAERAARDVQLAMARRVQDLAGFALAGNGPPALEGRVNELAARNELLEREVRLRREAESRIRAMAYQDPLTRLPNRGLLGDRFAVAIAQARRHGQKVAVLMLDLDNFKTVNDRLGHEVGDRLLTHAAALVTASVRESDTVARYGGDEFVLLLGELHHFSEAGMVAQKVVRRLAEPISLDGHELHLGGSIGMSIWPDDAGDLASLLRCADQALYAAKAEGRGTYRYFSEMRIA
jgi:diguanylate cyclase (GGDEF)-like protein